MIELFRKFFAKWPTTNGLKINPEPPLTTIIKRDCHEQTNKQEFLFYLGFSKWMKRMNFVFLRKKCSPIHWPKNTHSFIRRLLCFGAILSLISFFPEYINDHFLLLWHSSEQAAYWHTEAVRLKIFFHRQLTKHETAFFLIVLFLAPYIICIWLRIAEIWHNFCQKNHLIHIISQNVLIRIVENKIKFWKKLWIFQKEFTCIGPPYPSLKINSTKKARRMKIILIGKEGQ